MRETSIIPPVHTELEAGQTLCFHRCNRGIVEKKARVSWRDKLTLVLLFIPRQRISFTIAFPRCCFFSHFWNCPYLLLVYFSKLWLFWPLSKMHFHGKSGSSTKENTFRLCFSHLTPSAILQCTQSNRQPKPNFSLSIAYGSWIKANFAFSNKLTLVLLFVPKVEFTFQDCSSQRLI